MVGSDRITDGARLHDNLEAKGMTLFSLWLLAASVCEKVRKMSFGEFEREYEKNKEWARKQLNGRSSL